MAAMFESPVKKQLLKKIGIYFQYQLPTQEVELFALDVAFREAREAVGGYLCGELTREMKIDLVRLLNILKSCNYLVRDYTCECFHFRGWKKAKDYNEWYQRMMDQYEQNEEEWNKKVNVLKYDMQYYLSKKSGTYTTVKHFLKKEE